MTSIPSSPVQAQRGTDEQERLAYDPRLPAPKPVRSKYWAGYCACYDKAQVLLRADAETIRSLVDRLEEVEVSLHEKREQLAARSAEVEALRVERDRMRNGLIGIEQFVIAALQEKSRDAD